MSLPKIDVPTYDLTLPSTGETLKVRPFNVKEEKLLLLLFSKHVERQKVSREMKK